MRATPHYVLIRDFKVPGSDFAVALRTGDEITEEQRATAGLIIGLDVTPLSADVVARPGDDADRAEWQDYAVARGVPYAEAVNLDVKDLQAREEVQADPEPVVPDMPEASAVKATWVEYGAQQSVLAGQGRVTLEQARAGLADRTKADLIEIFGPNPDTAKRAEVQEALEHQDA